MNLWFSALYPSIRSHRYSLTPPISRLLPFIDEELWEFFMDIIPQVTPQKVMWKAEGLG